MCGLAGIHRRTTSQVRDINKLADALLLAIENRGQHATGFLALMDNGKVQMEKRTRPATSFVRTRGKIRRDARTVLLHTRWATVGAKENLANAHPVASGTIAAVHNGTIYNADEIFNTFSLPRQAEVDSEVVPALLMHAGWDKAKAALDLLEGGAALGIVNTERPDELLLAKTERYPMVYMVTDDLVVFASTRIAIEKAWREVYGSPAPGTFYEMKPWTLARVNGSIEVTEIRKYVPPKPPKRAPLKYKRSTAKVSGPAVSKRARRRARKALRHAPEATDLPVAVLLLMEEGYTEDEAYALIEPPLVADLEAEDEWRWYGDTYTCDAYAPASEGMSPATRAWYDLG